eukprot:15217240-Heterocapsa_arctica.AAC.1
MLLAPLPQRPAGPELLCLTPRPRQQPMTCSCTAAIGLSGPRRVDAFKRSRRLHGSSYCQPRSSLCRRSCRLWRGWRGLELRRSQCSAFTPF